MKLLIKNSEWLRGTGQRDRFYEGVLYDATRKCYCVQGLYCKALGLPDHVMDEEVQVCDVFPMFHWEPSREALWLVNDGEKSEAADKIETINDSVKTTDAEKIDLLRPIFAAHGVEIEYREDL